MAFRTQPGVHGLADAADFVEGRSVVIGPAKVQDLGEQGAVTLTLRRRGEVEERVGGPASVTFGLSSLMS